MHNRKYCRPVKDTLSTCPMIKISTTTKGEARKFMLHLMLIPAPRNFKRNREKKSPILFLVEILRVGVELHLMQCTFVTRKYRVSSN